MDDNDLRVEIARLKKIIKALMNRAERSTEVQSSDFNLFQTAVILEDQVRSRTMELEAALRDVENVSRALRASESMYRSVITSMVEGVVVQASNGKITSLNPAAERIIGRPYEELIGLSSDSPPWPVIREDGTAFPGELRPAMVTLRTGEPQFGVIMGLCKPGGVVTWISVTSQSTKEIAKGAGNSDLNAVITTFRDITERKWIEARDRLRSDILEKLAKGSERPVVLETLVRGMERVQRGRVVAILLVDENECLRKGSAPGLPEAFFASVEGQAVGEGIGICGTAALRGELCVVTDVQHQACLECERETFASVGLSACWAQPILGADERVMGVIAIFTHTPQTPTDQDKAFLNYAADLAGIVINYFKDEKRLRMAMQALETTRESVYWLDDAGRILYVNRAVEQELGYTTDELRRMRIADIDPRAPAEFWAKDGEMARRRRAGELRNFLTDHRHRDGHLVPVEIHSSSFVYEGTRYSMSIVHDIAARLAADEALRKSEAKFAAIFSFTPEPMALTRLTDGSIIDISRSFTEIFGYKRQDVVGRTTLSDEVNLWVHPDDRQRWTEKIIHDGEVLGFETSMRRRDGTVFPVVISGKLVRLGGETCVVSAAHDISEQKAHAERLEQIAHHDPLTGLSNRLVLGERLGVLIGQSRRTGTQVAVCYLDLDGFKRVNDTFGHDVGDCLLVEVAKRLLGGVRGADVVARLGGDEFVVALSGLTGEEECEKAVERLVKTVAAPYSVEGAEHAAISASVGVTVFPRDNADPDTLVRHADHAMYAAKQAGKNRYQWFDTHLEQRIEERNSTRRRLVVALEQQQLCLFYQPKVDCREGRVAGVEALIRWQHPVLGLLPPAEFLPLIEESDLALRVGNWVIREAVSQLAEWRRGGIDLRVSVNVFICQLTEPDFAAALAALVEQYPEVDPDCFQIEIVETAALEELDAIRTVIDDCRQYGFEFSLDDFGTGYSTLTHLRNLAASEIKIDQTFVRHMLERPEDRAIVESVIGLGRAFGRTVVAEGVETTSHIVRLLELGCDVMQGYALARPMEAKTIPAWVREFRPDSAWCRPPLRKYKNS